MKENLLFNKMWKLYDESDNESLLQWIERELKKNPKDVDYNYIFLEVLSLINYDNDREHKEPEVIQLCTELIRSREAIDQLTIAKAYAYRGEIKFLAIDRRKDFDKSRLILDKFYQKDSEVNFLNKFININYPLARREYLIMDPQVFRNQI